MKLKIMILALVLFPASAVQADFGSHFIVNSRSAAILDSSHKRISIRFTCQTDMNVIGLSVYCEKSLNPPAYLISLREDNAGLPSDNLLESSSITPKEAGWMTLTINQAGLFKGRVYHMVIEQDVNRGGRHPVGVIGPKNFASFAYTDFLNPFYPQNEKPDRKLNVLIYENKKWKEINRQPLFALYGSGNVFLGNPYDSPGERPIHGNGTPKESSDDQLQGQCLHPHCGFYPTGFALRVRQQGKPTEPLNYRVYTHDYTHHKTTFAYSGEALTPAKASNGFQWVTIGAPTGSRTDFPPECRYVVFQTDSGKPSEKAPGCDNCYVLSDFGNSGGLASGADLSFDGGPHLSRAATSSDGGTTWIDEFERDANVIILGPDCTSILTVPNHSPNPLPTPESLWRGLLP